MAQSANVGEDEAGGGAVRPGAAGLLIGIECSRVRDSTWIYPISFVTTRIGVELTVVQRNYPTRLWLDSNSARLGFFM